MGEIYKQQVGDWSVVMEWPDRAESGGPTRLVIEPLNPSSPPTGGLSSTVLRAVDFQAAADKLSAFFQMEGDRNQSRDQALGRRLRESLAEGLTDRYLVELCVAYIELVNRGRPHPAEYLSELVGKTASTVKGHLWQAKKRGLFKGSPGRVGGELTPEGQRIHEKSVMEALEESSKSRQEA